MASLAGYISDTELYYEESLGRNLLTGQGHSVTGSDNLIAGVMGTLIGDRTVLLSLDGAAHSEAVSGALVLRGRFIHNGSEVTSGVGDLSAALDALGT